MSDPQTESKAGALLRTMKATGGRSPAYPFIPLPRALERAEELKKAEGFYAVPPESAFKAWGFGEKSSGARQTLAALKHFGLVDYVGTSERRQVKLTDLAKRILLDVRPDSPEKPRLFREAALAPPIHGELIKEYPNGLPSDTTVQTFLVLEKGFNESGAKDLIAEFKETSEFARLYEPHNKPSMGADAGDSVLPPADEIEPGDLVQVEINGALQFDKPVRVREVRVHQGQTWIATEASDTWVRQDQVSLEAKGGPSPPPPLQPTPPQADSSRHQREAKEGWKEERLLDDTGGEIFLSYKGDPTAERYEFIRDYAAFKLQRFESQKNKPGGLPKAGPTEAGDVDLV